MKGTLKPGDKLTIEMVPFDQIRKGDVLIFRRTHEEQNDFIAHRVSRITRKGLSTKGDNCFDLDKESVQKENVIGKVILFVRRGKVRRAWNGCAGQMRAALLHTRLHVMKWLKFFLRKPYKKLKSTGMIAKLWHPDIELVQFVAPEGSFVKYLHKCKTVAVYWNNKSFSEVKRPFDLIL